MSEDRSRPIMGNAETRTCIFCNLLICWRTRRTTLHFACWQFARNSARLAVRSSCTSCSRYWQPPHVRASQIISDDISAYRGAYDDPCDLKGPSFFSDKSAADATEDMRIDMHKLNGVMFHLLIHVFIFYLHFSLFVQLSVYRKSHKISLYLFLHF